MIINKENNENNNQPTYVAIRFNKNIFHPSVFGNYDRNSAFIVNQTSGEVTKLTPEESYTYFKGESLFRPISNMMMEEVTSNNIGYYAITDGYLTLSMNRYDEYHNITYNNPQELHDNHKVIVIKIGRRGNLDYSDMYVVDAKGRRNLTEDEFDYYNGRYDSVLDYYMGGFMR